MSSPPVSGVREVLLTMAGKTSSPGRPLTVGAEMMPEPVLEGAGKTTAGSTAPLSVPAERIMESADKAGAVTGTPLAADAELLSEPLLVPVPTSTSTSTSVPTSVPTSIPTAMPRPMPRPMPGPMLKPAVKPGATAGASATASTQPAVARRPQQLKSISVGVKPKAVAEMKQHKEARDVLLAAPPANAGSAWLLEQRKKRPKGINDALVASGPNSKFGLEINCSLCTIGAMTNRTSSQMSQALGVKTGGQSMTVWADPSDNPENQDAAYDFGGQLGGMSNSLKEFAAASDGEVEFVDNTELVDGTRTKGVPRPGSDEEDEIEVPCKVAKPIPADELLAKMKDLPDGTRFAVMVFGSSDVETHWVNAEKFNGEIVFEDYQQNVKQKVPPARGQVGGDDFIDDERPTVGALPRGPVSGEDIFKRGMFMALKPTAKVLKG